MFRHSGLVASVLIPVMGLWGCSVGPVAGKGSPLDTTGAEPWRVEANLRPWSITWEDDFPQTEFSKTGEHICLWLGLSLGPVAFQVFDISGRKLGGSESPDYSGLLGEFPAIAWRWNRTEFVKGANFGGTEAFGFNADLSRGIRVVVPTNGVGPVVAEMWDLLEPPHRLWTQTLGQLQQVSSLRYAKPIGRFCEWRSGSAFIQLSGRSCAELDARTGEVRRRFTFGPIESFADARAQAKKLGWPEGDAGHLIFGAGCSDYDEKRTWIACGSWYDRRVRVFDVGRPEKLLFETYANAQPVRPGVGEWRVEEVKFLAGGSYLKAEYGFSARRGKAKRVLEIYETGSWRTVWQSGDAKLHGVTLAPDGRTMAYVRDAKLIVCAFKP